MQRSKSMRSKPISGAASASSGNGNQKATRRNNNKLRNVPNLVSAVRNNGQRFNTTRVESVPVAQSRRQKFSQPQYFYRPNGGILVRHRERIQVLNGSVAFTTTSLAINPGLSSTFPWLSGIASRYENYQFHRLVFEYRQKTTSSAVGDIIQAIDYNAGDAAPVTSLQMETYQDSISSAPWQDSDLVCSIKNLKKEKEYFVRTTALAANLDIKTYDTGNLFLGTESQASAALAGYVYACYDVEFMTPETSTSSGGDMFGGVLTGATAQSAANPYGTGGTMDAQTVGVTYPTVGASILTIQNPGTYVVTQLITGTVVTAIATPVAAGATVNALFNFLVNAAGTIAAISHNIVTTVANQTVTFTCTATTVTAAQCWVSSAPVNSEL